jgi:hypothetical protein
MYEAFGDDGHSNLMLLGSVEYERARAQRRNRNTYALLLRFACGKHREEQQHSQESEDVSV